MNNLLKFVFPVLILVIGLLACQNDSVKEQARQALKEAPAPAVETRLPDPQNEMRIPEGAELDVITGPVTTIKFDSEVYDFGKVKEGEVVTHKYKFKNTGKEPLILKDVKASCGCTAPSWSKTPIAPGKSGEIEVKFDTKGRGMAGGNPDSKRVTVMANTDPNPTYLTIKGVIDKKS